MPKGPQGQKSLTDAIDNAVHIARIATGEIEETTLMQLAKRKSSLAVAKVRQDNAIEAQCSEFAQKTAMARWG